MQTDVTLSSAYRAARAHRAPAFALQGYSCPGWYGKSYASPLDGIGAAAYALHKARENLDAFRAARAAYETAAKARDMAREEANESKAAAQSLAREGGPKYEAAAREVTERVAALDAAERAKATALREVSKARARCAAPCPSYGAGTWQGADESAPAAALPFNMPPAMRNGRHGWKPYRRAMSPGEEGGRFFADDDSGVVRNVRDAHDVARLEHTGWYDNPHGESFRDGEGLIIGVVGQLRGRNGRAVFVPGWRNGSDAIGGAVFDMRQAVTADGREEYESEEAAEQCARVAASLAEAAAERERDYQCAWGAGQQWADKGEELESIRAELLAMLKERRTAAKGETPNLCAALRAHVSGLLAQREELRREREELADGESAPYFFFADAEAKAAFCEGANVAIFPG